MGYLTELSRQKRVLNFFFCQAENFFNFAFFQFFLGYSFIYKARNLEADESNPIIDNNPISLSIYLSLSVSLSLSVRVSFLLFLVHVLSLALSLR